MPTGMRGLNIYGAAANIAGFPRAKSGQIIAQCVKDQRDRRAREFTDKKECKAEKSADSKKYQIYLDVVSKWPLQRIPYHTWIGLTPFTMPTSVSKLPD